MYRKFLQWILILGLIATSLVVGSSSSSADVYSPAFSSVNEVRSFVGLPALEPDAELEAKATSWSQQMAANGSISHSDLSEGITQPWTTLGENVGVGGDVESVVDALIASPLHYKNMVDARFNKLGVGIFFDGSRYWITQSFLQGRVQIPVAIPPTTSISLPPPTTVSLPPPTTVPVTAPPATTTIPQPTTTTTPPEKERVAAFLKSVFERFRAWLRKLF